MTHPSVDFCYLIPSGIQVPALTSPARDDACQAQGVYTARCLYARIHALARYTTALGGHYRARW